MTCEGLGLAAFGIHGLAILLWAYNAVIFRRARRQYDAMADAIRTRLRDDLGVLWDDFP